MNWNFSISPEHPVRSIRKPLYTITAILALILVLTHCKKNPVFSATNPVDPESSDYEISKPSNLSATFTSDGINLNWKASVSDFVTGYLIYRSKDEQQDYELIKELSSDKNEFIDTIDWNLIDVHYRLLAYFEKEDGTQVFSDTVQTDLNQSLYSAEAYWVSSDSVNISISHTFSPLSQLTIEQKIGDSDFEFLRKFQASETISIAYNSFPEELITYKLYAENEYTRSNDLIFTPSASVKIPNNIILEHISENEVKIHCEDYGDPITNIVLSKKNTNTNNYSEFDRIQSCSSSFNIDGLSYEHSYEFKISAQKGPYYSENNIYFSIARNITPKLTQEINTNIASNSKIGGEITSDGRYATISKSNRSQYVYDLENLQQVYAYEPELRHLTTQIVEYNNSTLFSRHFNEGNFWFVELNDIETHTRKKIIPPLYQTGSITEINFVRNTPYAVLYSPTPQNDNSVLLSVSVYDMNTSETVKVLTSTDKSGYFKLASSDKSILVYEVFENKLTRYSLDDFSLMNTLTLNSDEIEYIVPERDPGLLSQNEDVYYLHSTYDGVMRIDMDNPKIEVLEFDKEPHFISYFGSSNNGQLKCVVIKKNVDDRILRCFRRSLERPYTFDLEDHLSGFLLSDNDEFIIVFTDEGIKKYDFQNSTWELFITNEQ